MGILDIMKKINNVKRALTKEEMVDVIKQERLEKYFSIKFNNRVLSDFTATIIKKSEDDYHVIVTGERGEITMDSHYKEREEANYWFIRHLLLIKKIMNNHGDIR